MPTPLDLILREGPQPGSRVDPAKHAQRQGGIDMRCWMPRRGKSVCMYAPGPKHPQIQNVILPLARRYWRDGLSSAPADRDVLLSWTRKVHDLVTPGAGVEQWLDAMRAAIWSDVRYNDDPPGYDTVKMPCALIQDGEGDCVSLTVAMTCLAQFLSGGRFNVRWRIGGGPDPNEPGGFDPDKHIWPRFDRIPVEMTMNIPVGDELRFDAIREENP
ncbi:MAG: hypothetical protein ICCCNLDF_02820 [Planctomycetes bacterium]|nr:hypothetical protein [Planctomycetota bacterium]